MKVLKSVAVLLVLTVLSGCSTFTPPWERYIAQENPSESVFQQMQVPLSATVGTPIVSGAVGMHMIRYTPTSPNIKLWRQKISHFNGFADDERDELWVPRYHYGRTDGDYIITSTAFFGDAVGVIVKADGSTPKKPVIRVDRRGSFERHPLVLPPGVVKAFNRDDSVFIKDGGFSFEILYVGRSGHELKLVYREYIKGIARQAFQQELSYDLAASDIIKFKSLKIKVLGASNSELRYVILSDGGLPWMPK